jgi:hypothetical protein
MITNKNLLFKYGSFNILLQVSIKTNVKAFVTCQDQFLVSVLRSQFELQKYQPKNCIFLDLKKKFII